MNYLGLGYHDYYEKMPERICNVTTAEISGYLDLSRILSLLLNRSPETTLLSQKTPE